MAISLARMIGYQSASGETRIVEKSSAIDPDGLLNLQASVLND